MKIIKTIYLHAKWDEYARPNFVSGVEYNAADMEMTEHFGAVAATAEVTFDLPDDFDPRVATAEILREEIKTVRAEAEAKCNALQSKIDNMLALECKA